MSRARATRKWHLRLCKRLRIRPTTSMRAAPKRLSTISIEAGFRSKPQAVPAEGCEAGLAHLGAVGQASLGPGPSSA